MDAAELQGSHVLGLLCERKATADLELCAAKYGERYERQKAQLRSSAAAPRNASAPLYLVESNSDALQRVRPGAHSGGVEQGYSVARVLPIHGQAEAGHLMQSLVPLRSAGIEASTQKLEALACPLATHRLAAAWAGSHTFGECVRGVLHGRGQLRAAGTAVQQPAQRPCPPRRPWAAPSPAQCACTQPPAARGRAPSSAARCKLVRPAAPLSALLKAALALGPEAPRAGALALVLALVLALAPRGSARAGQRGAAAQEGAKRRRWWR